MAGAQAATVAGQQVPQAAATLPAAQAAVPLAAPELNQLALSIASKSLEGAKQFDIRLDPAELGRVDVRLSVDGSGTAQAHLAAERPETLALLQNNAGTLSRALQDSGVQVASNGLQFSLKGQERQADGQQRAPSRSRSSAAPGIEAGAAVNGGVPNYGLSPTGEGVNILV
jgi:flagellar hook-length control protein FliK